ncbi:hypothetical protein BUALT_Bualt01G0206700 [Buddleja alternifolia]|uniref:Uncharacterized protein n=1 Tax=Buddleja alternifolia TaxID=168488 RepID=A0AAV6YFP8_9LAMI|nr:hypothetical protein BUALT_Bualt01G0206700 [Buddleja alternifolia]
MERPSLLSIQTLVSEIKKKIFSDHINFGAFVTPSAYDTAWLAMIPDHENKNGPMFGSCLDWIVENQKEGGFWGETNEEGLPTIDALTSTLACLLALLTWNAGHPNIQRELAFIHSKAEILLKINSENLPRWFILTFPAMIEFVGLDLIYPHGLSEIVDAIFKKRQQILQTEELVNKSQYYPPLISYLETLPSSTYHNHLIEKHLSSDGSLFQSPSATARAFMITGNVKCLKYLQSLLQTFPNGVPTKYPVDEEMIKLCMVDQVQRLGVAEHFNQEIEKIMAEVYRNQTDYKSGIPTEANIIPAKLFKDALAFRLLRMQGHYVNPGSLCWFLHEADVLVYMEENYEQFISAMYSVYRATDLLFPGENELEEARTFATKILQKSKTRNSDHNILISKGLHNVIKYELNFEWIARMDHLYHRMWIEENKTSPLWTGKASYYRLSCLDHKNLMELAVENFEFRRSIYAQELAELKRWSKQWGLSEMGFGREKTTLIYFATATGTCLPYNSTTRLEIAKAGIIVVVADDFYDMEGSLAELEVLTNAVKRWDGKGLEGHGKTIFDALDNFVNDIAAKCHPQQGINILPKLQNIWRETFMSWMVEKSWSQTGYIPSMDEYLQIGTTSVGAHAIVLSPTICQVETQNLVEYDQNITKLVMSIARLANDTQSYQKEEADGKVNLVLLHLKENRNMSIEDSITYVREILEVKRKEFLRHVFMDDMSESYKSIHLFCMRAFEMFYTSENLFDRENAFLDAISKAIYLPIHQMKPLLASNPSEKKKTKEISKIPLGFIQYT